MGTFKKLLGAAAIVGAALGGATLLKNRKEQRYTEDDVFEDFDDEKVFDIKTNSDKNGNQKVTISFNSNKAKSMVNNATDKVLDASDIAVDKIKDTVGEEKYEAAKEKVNSATSFVKEKATTVKDVAIEKIGEDRIDDAKDLLSEAVDLAKEKGSEVLSKIKNVNEDSDIFDIEYSDIEEDDNDESPLETDDIFEDEDLPLETDDIFEDEDDDLDTIKKTIVKEELNSDVDLFDDEVDMNDESDDFEKSPNTSIDELDELDDIDDILTDDVDIPPEGSKSFDSFDFLKKPTDIEDDSISNTSTDEDSKDESDFLDDELDEL